MNELTTLELAVMKKLLAGDSPLFQKLREQASVCRVTLREMTGHGFFAHLSVGEAAPVGNKTFHFGDVVATIEGLEHGAGFELYVRDGRLNMLEGYAYDELWPTSPSRFTVSYSASDQRDWSCLEKELGELLHG